jgi:hypothetical protein
MLKGPMIPGVAPATPAVFVRLSEADYLVVAELAEQQDMSLAKFVRSIVRQHLDTQTADRLAPVDRSNSPCGASGSHRTVSIATDTPNPARHLMTIDRTVGVRS